MLVLAATLLLQAGALASPSSGARMDSVQLNEGRDRIPSALVPQELWTPEMPHVRFAPARSRYNRIEGLSLAAVAGWETGASSTATMLLRLGVADLVPNAELELSRTRAFNRKSVSAYYRLSASNEWGNPLLLGASLGALIIGRDEGFYYRAAGAELTLSDSTTSTIDARLFVERQRSARVKNNFSFADAFGNRDFHHNITADDADIAGVSAAVAFRRGVLATESRLFAEARVELAAGDFDYARGMLEGTVSQPLSPTFLFSVTASAGTSGGTLPVQRNWFLGGTRSVRGQRAGFAAGDAFWMSQVELGTINVFARPVVFFDAGWAGHRNDFTAPGRVGTGAGIGGSFFDGSLRFDLARGIYPGVAWRGSLYLEARM